MKSIVNLTPHARGVVISSRRKGGRVELVGECVVEHSHGHWTTWCLHPSFGAMFRNFHYKRDARAAALSPANAGPFSPAIAPQEVRDLLTKIEEART